MFPNNIFTALFESLNLHIKCMQYNFSVNGQTGLSLELDVAHEDRLINTAILLSKMKQTKGWHCIITL